MNEWPQSLRPVAKYVARGNEVEATNPVVAFNCNLYAVKQAIRLNKGDGEAFIKSLLEKTEALKKVIGSNVESHQEIVEAYALEKFSIADDADVLGPVTSATAKLYFHALCFMDVCNVFKARSDDVEKKSQFTKSRMIAIQKALRDGSDPRRPEVIKAEEDELLGNSNSNKNNVQYAPTDYPPQSSETPPPPPPENISDGVGRMNLHQGGGGGRPGFPEKAPFWQTFIDPVKSDPNKNHHAQQQPNLHIPPPTRPLPSLPSSANPSEADYHGHGSTSASSIPPMEYPTNTSPYSAAPAPAPPTPVSPYQSYESTTSATNGQYNPSVQQVKNAQTNAKHAVSALDFSDFAGAIGFLEEAIAELKRSAR